MPRQARIKSESGIYHVMLRGINRQIIFEDEEDNLKFLETLQAYRLICGYEIYAYCLMGNHVHLLIREGKESLELAFKRIAGSYVYWYNHKYYRIGHLFQDRYKSEPVDDEQYLLTVLRYIHQNPLKAGSVEKMDEYRYSSYNDYIKGSSLLVNTDFIFSIIGKENFVKFHDESSDDKCLDNDEVFRLSDNDAKKTIKEVSQCDNSSDFQKLEAYKKAEYIKVLRGKGLSIRQICRLTGESFGVVRKY